MSSEESLRFLNRLKQEAPKVAKLALGAAAEAFKLRPEFLKKQPRARQAEWMRRALGRNIGAAIAEEVLASYFMEHKSPLLAELLDEFGVEHDEGALKNTPECPPKKKLQSVLKKFRGGDDADTRELLLMAFAGQSSVDWGPLEELLGVDER